MCTEYMKLSILWYVYVCDNLHIKTEKALSNFFYILRESKNIFNYCYVPMIFLLRDSIYVLQLLIV